MKVPANLWMACARAVACFAAWVLLSWALFNHVVGCRPAPRAVIPQAIRPPQEPGFFRNVASAAGLDFHLGHATREHINILETIGHGCAFLDYDGDGKLDILLVGSTQCKLYRNLGDGRFADVSAKALPSPPPNAHFLGCSIADYDDDGCPDILLTGYGCAALYHNRGDGTFQDVTAGSGLAPQNPFDWMTSAAWADVDSDGKLDVYICRYVQFTPTAKQLCGFASLDGSQTLMACAPARMLP